MFSHPDGMASMATKASGAPHQSSAREADESRQINFLHTLINILEYIQYSNSVNDRHHFVKPEDLSTTYTRMIHSIQVEDAR